MSVLQPSSSLDDFQSDLDADLAPPQGTGNGDESANGTHFVRLQSLMDRDASLSYTIMPTTDASSTSPHPSPTGAVWLRASIPSQRSLPPRFPLAPVIQNHVLRKLGKHRWFYPSMIAIVVPFMVVGAFDSAWWQLWTMVGLLFLFIPIFLIQLTWMDRCILKLLCFSFEYWWLLLNAVGYAGIVIYDSFINYSLITSLCFIIWHIAFLGIAFLLLSLDALPMTPRRIKLLILFGFLCTLIRDLISRGIFHDLHPAPICLVYCTTTKSLWGSFCVNIAVFTLKYLVLSVIRPRQLLMLAARLRCEPEIAYEAVPSAMATRASIDAAAPSDNVSTADSNAQQHAATDLSMQSSAGVGSRPMVSAPLGYQPPIHRPV